MEEGDVAVDETEGEERGIRPKASRRILKEEEDPVGATAAAAIEVVGGEVGVVGEVRILVVEEAVLLAEVEEDVPT